MLAVIFCSILFLLTRMLRLLILTVDFQLTSVRLCLTKPAYTAANLITYLLPTINSIKIYSSFYLYLPCCFIYNSSFYLLYIIYI